MQRVKELISVLNNEDVIAVQGAVVERPADNVNSKITSGEIEIEASDFELLNKAIALSMANALGKTDLVNLEMDWIREASKEDLIQGASQILKPENACTLHYRSSK